MGMSFLITFLFFMPWFGMNPDFDMFEQSRTSYSAFSLVRGIHFAAPMVGTIGKMYGFSMASKLIYLGYLFAFVPILGLASIVMSGMRHKYAEKVHLAQYIFTLALILIIAIVFNINADMRQLFKSIWTVGFAMPLSAMIACLGIGLYVMKKNPV